MERNPNNFFRDFDKAVEDRKGRSNAVYQKKILKRYFPHLLEDLEGLESSPNPLQLVKDNIFREEAENLNIENIKLDLLELLKLPSTDIWSKFSECIEGRENVTLVFPVTGAGDWCMHNSMNVPDGTVNVVNILIHTEEWGNVYAYPLKQTKIKVKENETKDECD
jgi:hypothetical protein